MLASKRFILLFAVCALSLLSANRAVAQNNPDVCTADPNHAECQRTNPSGKLSEENRTRARVHYTKGEALFKAKQYREAIAEFERAYALAPVPVLLLNLAQTHRVAGNKRRARTYYERFLHQGSTHPMAKEAARIYTELDREITAQEAAEAARKQRRRQQYERDVRRAQSAGRVTRIGGLVALGLGVVGLGVASGFAIHARSLQNKLTSHNEAWTDALLAEFDRGAQSRTRARWMGAIGGALVTSGTILYLLGRHQRTHAIERVQRAVHISAGVSTSSVTAAARVSF